jgi:hypothetical protein
MRGVRAETLGMGCSLQGRGPQATMLNDISIGRDHVFRSESHVLPDFTPGEK